MNLEPFSMRVYLDLMARCGVKQLTIYYVKL